MSHGWPGYKDNTFFMTPAMAKYLLVSIVEQSVKNNQNTARTSESMKKGNRGLVTPTSRLSQVVNVTVELEYLTL